MTTAFIAIGSNLGDRARSLDRAVARLRAEPHVRVAAVSDYYETAPVDCPPDSGAYLNGAVRIETDLEPAVLLARLLEIEVSMGRIRSLPNASRTLDLDIVLFGDRIVDAPDLVVPHPRMHQRRFVLQPVCQLDPEFVHPGFGVSVRTLLDRLPSEEFVPRVFDRTPARTRELDGMRILVTGSKSGIGKAMARQLALAGAKVVIHGRSRERADELAHSIVADGGGADTVVADLADRGSWEGLIERSWGQYGGLDGFISNAGADTLTGEAAGWSFERKWQELVMVDIAATMVLCREIGTRMKLVGHGSIVTVGWDRADTGMEGDSGEMFAASKGAIAGFTRSLAKTLAPRVRVNCLAAGWIRTAWGEGASARWQERVRNETPLGRWGLPEDLANAATWLMDPRSGFVTGQVLRINGGAV